VVQRIQLVTAAGPPDHRILTLTDVARSPRWFTRRAPILAAPGPETSRRRRGIYARPATPNSTGARQAGVILTLSLAKPSSVALSSRPARPAAAGRQPARPQADTTGMTVAGARFRPGIGEPESKP
jgi:hypothetical protein